MILSDASAPVDCLRLDVHRTTQPAYLRETALDAERGFAAFLRLENATFQPLGTGEIVCAGAVKISFPNPRTLRIMSCQVARRLAHGVPLAVFGATSIRLRNLAVVAEENAIALVGEITQARLPGEWSLSLSGLAEVCHLPPTTVTRPFAFPLPRRPDAGESGAKSEAAAASLPSGRSLGSRRPTSRSTPSRYSHSRPTRLDRA